MGELHLDIKVEDIQRTHGVEAMGKPQVAYRETITQTVEDTYTQKKPVVLATPQDRLRHRAWRGRQRRRVRV